LEKKLKTDEEDFLQDAQEFLGCVKTELKKGCKTHISFWPLKTELKK
jgi:hypothetical protein